MSDLVYKMYKDIQKLINRSLACEKGCEHSAEPLFKEWEKAIEQLEQANPDYKVRYQSECGIRTEIENMAFMELKSQLVEVMLDFTEKYAPPGSPLYPKSSYLMVDALTSCLSDAQELVTRYHPFTARQIDHICYQIGEWYIHMKSLLEGTQHNLGSQKEVLKNLICGEEPGR